MQTGRHDSLAWCVVGMRAVVNLFGMRTIYGQKSGPNHVLRVEPWTGSLTLHCLSSLYCNYGPLAI